MSDDFLRTLAVIFNVALLILALLMIGHRLQLGFSVWDVPTATLFIVAPVTALWVLLRGLRR